METGTPSLLFVDLAGRAVLRRPGRRMVAWEVASRADLLVRESAYPSGQATKVRKIAYGPVWVNARRALPP